MEEHFKVITVQELYDLAKSNDALDYKLRVQYRDDGGEYSGEDDLMYLFFDSDKKTLTL